MGALQEYPVVAKRSAVVEDAVVPDRPPSGILGGGEDGSGGDFDFGKIRAHGVQDGGNLAGVNAPHPQKSEFQTRPTGVLATSSSSVVTLCVGTTPHASAAAAISHQRPGKTRHPHQRGMNDCPPRANVLESLSKKQAIALLLGQLRETCSHIRVKTSKVRRLSARLNCSRRVKFAS